MIGQRPLPINPCPKCGSELRLIIEAEYRGKQSNISYGYICSVCRYKERVEQISIELNSDKLLISRVKHIK
ncbi:MAG: hypothetical protein N3D82_03835 [Ignisphaera sp.]|nr:hypothetical protein [Ignisphaera sp.]